MKNKQFSLMGILAMTLVFGMVLAGCPTDNSPTENTSEGNNDGTKEGGDDNLLKGTTWECSEHDEKDGDEKRTIFFSTNSIYQHTFVFGDGSPTTGTGKYSISEDVVSLMHDDDPDKKTTKYRISGDQLIAVDSDRVYIKKK